MIRVLLSATVILSAHAVQAGCSDAPKDGPNDTRICSVSGCEEVRALRSCSTTDMVFTEFSNGWAVIDRLKSPWATEVWKDDRELTPAETDAVTCTDLNDGSSCLGRGAGMVDPATFDTAQDSFDGLCLDVGSGGCTERFLPFGDRSLGLCEENCTFETPVRVRGMSATLYDVTCRGDHTGPDGHLYRVLLKAEERSLSLINFPFGTRVVPCS